MTKYERFHQLLEQLLQKSRENKVRWVAFSLDGKISRVRKYGVKFSSQAQLELAHTPSKGFSDEVKASLQVGGKEIESMYGDNNFEEFPLLWALVEEAERGTTQWDKAIDEIEDLLNSDAEVGLPMNQELHLKPAVY